jgi:hypothetical protein
MRLLDEIAQCAAPLCLIAARPGHPPGPRLLPGPADFAAPLRSCPWRYVLNDALTAACTELAIAGGERLRGCLDLVRLPAERCWIEWNDTIRARLFNAAGIPAPGGAPACQRAGVLVEASADRRRAVLHSFWTDALEGVCLAQLETHVDLSCAWPAPGAARSVLVGGFTRLTAADDTELERLLECARCRFQPAWAGYYRDAQLAPAAAAQLLRGAAGIAASGLPIVLAFSLLLGARQLLEQRRIDRRRLNRRRLARQHPPLLEHIEVRCPPALGGERGRGAGPRASRAHAVPGQLVRRGDELIWRRAPRAVYLSFAAAPR